MALEGMPVTCKNWLERGDLPTSCFVQLAVEEQQDNKRLGFLSERFLCRGM